MSRFLRALGILVCLAAFACSHPPRSTPDAVITSAATTLATNPSGTAPDVGAQAVSSSDGGEPDPLEAFHDAEPVPVDKPEKLRPHSLRVILDENNTVFGNVGLDPHLSEDGTIVIALQDRSSFEAKRALVVLLVRELDHPERDRELIVVDSPDCRVSPNPPPCDRVGAEASAKKVNVFLAKHKWVELREYLPWMPPSDVDDCHGLPLARHFRAAGYIFQFREPHLRIAREDGALIADRSDLMITENPTGCSKSIRTFIGNVGIDVRRRAMWVIVARCKPDRYVCRLKDEWLFFRLPKPSN